MARARKQPELVPERPSLVVPRSKAEEILNRHADQGRELITDAESVTAGPSWIEWRTRFDRWRSVTEDAVRSIYTTDERSQDFKSSVSYIFRQMNQSDVQTFTYQRNVIGKGTVLEGNIDTCRHDDFLFNTGS